MKKRVLVTGGMGYIGSHTVVELLQHDNEVVIVDNLSNSEAFVQDRIDMITSLQPTFFHVDFYNMKALKAVFKKESIFDMVIHFAASKAVAESIKLPLKYFQNNLVSLLNLLQCMQQVDCSNIVFSSSATVYGDPDELRAKETTVFKKALSADGSTKQIGEDILEKVASTGMIKVNSSRYFNTVGAHDSGLIGESPIGTPNNLMTLVAQTAIGKIKLLTVY